MRALADSRKLDKQSALLKKGSSVADIIYGFSSRSPAKSLTSSANKAVSNSVLGPGGKKSGPY